MIDIEKELQHFYKQVLRAPKSGPEVIQITVLFSIAEQLKRIADLMQAEKNERRENRLREAFRASSLAAQQPESKDDRQP